MRITYTQRLVVLGLVGGMALACMPGVSWATAVYSATATGELTITGIENLDNDGDLNGLDIFGDAFVAVADAVFSGSAESVFSGQAEVLGDPVALGVGDGLLQESRVSGWATGDGDSSSIHLTTGSIDIVNSSTDSFQVDFTLTYSLAVDAMIAPVEQDAFASAVIEVFLLDEVLLSEFLLADPLIGTDSLPLTSQMFSLTLAPGAGNTLEMFVDADGFASSVAVPAPPALGLLLFGLLVLTLSRQSRNAAAQT